MQVGDLVRFGSTTPDNRTPIQKIAGLVIDISGIGMCSMGVTEPYKMGSVNVLWSDARLLCRETYASLEVINEGR